MQTFTLTTLLATALLSLSSSASPLSAEKRQVPVGAPRVYARFYGDGGCNTEWLEDTVFLESGTHGLAGCQDLTVGPFASTYFYENNFNATGTSNLSPFRVDKELKGERTENGEHTRGMY